MCTLRFIRSGVVIRNRTRDFPLSKVLTVATQQPGTAVVAHYANEEVNGEGRR